MRAFAFNVTRDGMCLAMKANEGCLVVEILLVGPEVVVGCGRSSPEIAAR